MPRMQATRIAAQAVSKLKSADALLIWMPSEVSEPPKYSPTIAPIIASTLATLSEAKRYGSEVGMRTRRKICTSAGRVGPHQLDRRTAAPR